MKDQRTDRKLFFGGVDKKLTTNDERLLECIDSKVNPLSELIRGIPLHSQAVERAIKMVSDSSKQAGREANRNGIIASKIALRRILKKITPKKISKIL